MGGRGKFFISAEFQSIHVEGVMARAEIESYYLANITSIIRSSRAVNICDKEYGEKWDIYTALKCLPHS